MDPNRLPDLTPRASVIRELRGWLATQLISWAISLDPEGTILACVLIARQARKATRELLAQMAETNGGRRRY